MHRKGLNFDFLWWIGGVVHFFKYLCLNQFKINFDMAKIKFGMMMTDASGKLGGQVFSKNRGGSYVRTKVTPLNPQSTAQMSVRGIFASISSSWSALLEGQRATFNNFVSDYARTDIFGDLRNPSGKNLYQRLNQNLAISGQASISVCVSPSEVPFANVQSADGDISNTEFIVNTQGETTDSKLVIWATAPLSQGTSFVKNKLRQIAVVDGGSAIQADVWAEYVAKFGTPTAGANIFVGVRVINANGQASPLETIKATIVA